MGLRQADEQEARQGQVAVVFRVGQQGIGRCRRCPAPYGEERSWKEGILQEQSALAPALACPEVGLRRSLRLAKATAQH